MLPLQNAARPRQRAPEDGPRTQSATDDKSRYTWTRNADRHSLEIHIIQPETLPKPESDAGRATDGKSRYTKSRWHGEFANRSCFSLRCATFLKEICFLILGAENPDSGCATFPGADETLPRPCSQSARSLRGLTYLCFTERCLCDALSFASEVCRVIGHNTVSTRLRSSVYLVVAQLSWVALVASDQSSLN